MLVKFFQLKFSILGFPLFKVGLPVFLLTKKTMMEQLVNPMKNNRKPVFHPSIKK
jgi:hypothetical protein